MNFNELFITFAFIGLIIVGFLGFAINFQQDNNVINGFDNNTLINNSYVDLQDELGSFRDQGQTQKDLFESENPTAGLGTILLFSIVSVGKVFNAMIVGVFNIVIKIPAVIFGIDPIILGVITTLLILSIVVSLWVLYKLGG